MNIDARQALEEMKVDRSNLYREESFTDLKVASLKMLTPINPDGSRDLSRPVSFIAQTQLMSQVGPLPINAQIDAGTLEEAIAKFPEVMRAAVEEMVEEIKQLQRREMSRIVVPGAETTSKILSGG